MAKKVITYIKSATVPNYVIDGGYWLDPSTNRCIGIAADGATLPDTVTEISSASDLTTYLNTYMGNAKVPKSSGAGVENFNSSAWSVAIFNKLND